MTSIIIPQTILSSFHPAKSAHWAYSHWKACSQHDSTAPHFFEAAFRPAAHNLILFSHAKQLADYVGKEDEGKWYQQQLDKFEESIREWEMKEDVLFDEFTAPKQIPVV